MTNSYPLDDARSYVDDIVSVLNPSEKTLILFSDVNLGEGKVDKIKAVDHLLGELGEWKGRDPDTGFDLVEQVEGHVLKIADLVDDDSLVPAALKDPAQKSNQDHVDIIISEGMPEDGFDWTCCEHVLTVGYPSAPIEIVQIIERTTKNASGKAQVRFTNLITTSANV